MDREKLGSNGRHMVSEDPDSPANLAEYPEEVQDEIKTYWRLIRTNRSTSNLLDHTYNYRWSATD
uniref:Uncharacterized protein n=1 Tax=Romanomermis culicivorax TaxID=13658 RepID=A0A915HNK3_ROMCU